MTKLNFLFCASREKDVIFLQTLFESISEYHSFNYQIFTRAHLLEQITYATRDNIVIINNVNQSSFLDKTYAIKNCEFEKFIFLDCDTFLLESLFDLWSLIEKYNVCIAHAPRRYTHIFKSVPAIFPEFNTGVIGIKRTDTVNKLINKWHLMFSMHIEDEGFPASKDQPFFRKSLYESNINFFTLTNEYNCRFKMGVSVCNNVKILHGYTKTIEELTAVINDINSTDTYKQSMFSNEADIRYIKY